MFKTLAITTLLLTVNLSRAEKEKNYLNNIDSILQQRNIYELFSIDSKTPVYKKLSLGYKACEDFESGESFSDSMFPIAMSQNDGISHAAHIIYYDTLGRAAINNLCPEYKNREK